jgi:hypothetical protein
MLENMLRLCIDVQYLRMLNRDYVIYKTSVRVSWTDNDFLYYSEIDWPDWRSAENTCGASSYGVNVERKNSGLRRGSRDLERGMSMGCNGLGGDMKYMWVPWNRLCSSK